MADEFFRNVDAVLSGVAPEPATVAPGTAVQPPSQPTAGQVFEAPPSPPSGTQPGFVLGVAVGAAAALLGAVVGGWIASRRRG
jgi:hypothetical protein